MPIAQPPVSLTDAQLPTDRPFTLADARRRGLTSTDLGKLIGAGGLQRLFRGVYAATVPETAPERARALALAVPESAIVTGTSAAWLYGVELHHRFDVGTWSRSVSYVRDPDRYQPEDLCTIEGVRVTTPLRTACDLGRTETRDAALGALDALLRLGEFSHDQLREQVPRFRGRYGVGQLRALVPLADARSDSPAASALRIRWIDAGLPAPQLQLPVVVDDVRIPWDVADPTVKYAAVVEPEDFEGTSEQITRVDARRVASGRDGWTIDVFGPGDLVGRGGATGRLGEGHRRASDRHHRPEVVDSWSVELSRIDGDRWPDGDRWLDGDCRLDDELRLCRDCGRRLAPYRFE